MVVSAGFASFIGYYKIDLINISTYIFIDIFAQKPTGSARV